MGDDSLRYSLVIPVWNEGSNVDRLFTGLASIPRGAEILICYDTVQDDTLPAIARLDDSRKPRNLRLVHNTLGRGVRYAIEAGMRAASAPVVVVTMADLSDDYSNLEAMVAAAEDGAAVVAGSRYMRGGKQIGGPLLKRFLSRMAGLSLHHMAGIPTHDATNSYKAYRSDFLSQTQIDSVAGFVLGLELTVKAHFAGERVEEIPAVWTDRTEGESRFKLWTWMPIYLRWYLWAFAQQGRRLVVASMLAARRVPSK